MTCHPALDAGSSILLTKMNWTPDRVRHGKELYYPSNDFSNFRALYVTQLLGLSFCPNRPQDLSI